jgi:hypothetical protein
MLGERRHWRLDRGKAGGNPAMMRDMSRERQTARIPCAGGVSLNPHEMEARDLPQRDAPL